MPKNRKVLARRKYTDSESETISLFLSCQDCSNFSARDLATLDPIDITWSGSASCRIHMKCQNHGISLILGFLRDSNPAFPSSSYLHFELCEPNFHLQLLYQHKSQFQNRQHHNHQLRHHRHLSVKQRKLVSVKFQLKINQERTETKKIDITEIVSTKSQNLSRPRIQTLVRGRSNFWSSLEIGNHVTNSKLDQKLDLGSRR